MQNFVYLLLDGATKRAAIVDPQFDIETPLALLHKHGFTLERILLTHTHHDHIAGLPALIARFPGIPIHSHKLDERRLHGSRFKDAKFEPLEDDQEILIGSLRVRAMHTPGHSAGELCYFLEKPGPFLLTGDTIFIRDCGRTDLETGSNQQMFESVQRIRTLPPETVILPGIITSPSAGRFSRASSRKARRFGARVPRSLRRCRKLAYSATALRKFRS